MRRRRRLPPACARMHDLNRPLRSSTSIAGYEKGAQLNLKNSQNATPLGILAGRNRGAQPADVSRANLIEFLRKLGAVE